jgi:hypothetical protein
VRVPVTDAAPAEAGLPPASALAVDGSAKPTTAAVAT